MTIVAGLIAAHLIVQCYLELIKFGHQLILEILDNYCYSLFEKKNTIGNLANSRNTQK